MNIWQENNSADKFFKWSHSVISKQDSKLKRILEMKKRGDILLNDDYLPTKYTLEGNESLDEWPNFQLDGYGTWLWSLSEHIRISNNIKLVDEYWKSIKIVIEYLINFWNYPCFDCWQENGEKIHTSTLAAIYGGLKAINMYIQDERLERTASLIKQYVADNCIVDERLKKCIDDDNIDGSLLWAAVPFDLFKVNDFIIENTVKEIEEKLVNNIGVHRYIGDTYYGGGEWIVLSASLGLYYCKVNQIEKAKDIIRWIEGKAKENGELGEQILEQVNDENYIKKWTSLWGDVASPVLWAHAMYLILLYYIKKYS